MDSNISNKEKLIGCRSGCDGDFAPSWLNITPQMHDRRYFLSFYIFDFQRFLYICDAKYFSLLEMLTYPNVIHRINRYE